MRKLFLHTLTCIMRKLFKVVPTYTHMHHEKVVPTYTYMHHEKVVPTYTHMHHEKVVPTYTHMYHEKVVPTCTHMYHEKVVPTYTHMYHEKVVPIYTHMYHEKVVPTCTHMYHEKVVPTCTHMYHETAVPTCTHMYHEKVVPTCTHMLHEKVVPTYTHIQLFLHALTCIMRKLFLHTLTCIMRKLFLHTRTCIMRKLFLHALTCIMRKLFLHALTCIMRKLFLHALTCIMRKLFLHTLTVVPTYAHMYHEKVVPTYTHMYQEKIMNFLFILYYMVEQGLILACMGFRRYRYSWANIYDGSIVLLLLISEIITVALYGFPFFSRSEVENNITLWNIVRFINILIMFRVLRIIWHIKAMAIVAHTLLDLVKNLQSFGGILIVIYYFFAMLGMELFQNKITYNPGNGSVHAGIGNGSYIKPANMTCGTYEQLDYWANNFDDFAASLVVLWDVMVVNNWMVFLYAYGKYTSKWSYLYFIAWWLTSVILILNLFTALILENFIMKWDRFYDSQQRSRAVQPSMGDGGGQRRSRALSQSMKMDTLTVHDIFRSNLKEPEEREILENLSQLRFFHYVDVRRHTESFVT
ncbi:TPC2-like protein [Mya arenaria]|uniref:TPC2-like protein n=1 Tax=Mya arenaria TaxID=6604 RepID=A0ABY7EEE8_MYAAR|nr:TPC2-like protein [Mya arenaria]